MAIGLKQQESEPKIFQSATARQTLCAPGRLMANKTRSGCCSLDIWRGNGRGAPEARKASAWGVDFPGVALRSAISWSSLGRALRATPLHALVCVFGAVSG